MRYYAIGDIHGQLDMLKAAHERIAADRAETGDAAAPVVHLGDLVDRGPDSRGVIQFIIDGLAEGAPWIVLRGNHDAIFQDVLSGQLEGMPTSPGGLSWIHPRMGGDATLRSYGLRLRRLKSNAALLEEAREAVPESHLNFLKSLRDSYSAKELLFVHAGIRPGLPLSRQNRSDLHWIRDEFLLDTTNHGPLVVHGHTPVAEPEHHGNRVNLDTGAGFGWALTAAVFEGRDVSVLTDAGRRALTPLR